MCIVFVLTIPISMAIVLAKHEVLIETLRKLHPLLIITCIQQVSSILLLGHVSSKIRLIRPVVSPAKFSLSVQNSGLKQRFHVSTTHDEHLRGKVGLLDLHNGTDAL